MVKSIGEALFPSICTHIFSISTHHCHCGQVIIRATRKYTEHVSLVKSHEATDTELAYTPVSHLMHFHMSRGHKLGMFQARLCRTAGCTPECDCPRGRSCYGACTAQTSGIPEDPPSHYCNHEEAAKKEQKLPKTLWGSLAAKTTKPRKTSIMLATTPFSGPMGSLGGCILGFSTRVWGRT